jgi:hypothetical protein
VKKVVGLCDEDGFDECGLCEKKYEADSSMGDWGLTVGLEGKSLWWFRGKRPSSFVKAREGKAAMRKGVRGGRRVDVLRQRRCGEEREPFPSSFDFLRVSLSLDRE